MSKKRSSFRDKVAHNSHAQNTAGAAYGYLRLPKGVTVFKEKPASRASLDFLAYKVSTDNHLDRDEALEIALKGELWYKRPFKIHRNVGIDNDMEICPHTFKKKCPICDYRDKLLKDGAEWNNEEVKAVRASDRNLYVVVPKDHDEYEEVPHVWDISQFCFQDTLNDELEEDGDNGIFPDAEDGLTLKIRFGSKAFGKKGKPFAITNRIDFVERDKPYSEEIMKKIPDLDAMIVTKSYEELHAKFFELDGEVVDVATTEVPPEKEEESGSAPEVCVACEGSGKNSNGKICRICKGTKLKPITIKEEVPKDNKEERILARKKKNAEDAEERAEAKAKAEEAELEKRAAAEHDIDNPCPYGHVFGADLEKFEHCSTECEKWDACLDAQEDSDN